MIFAARRILRLASIALVLASALPALGVAQSDAEQLAGLADFQQLALNLRRAPRDIRADFAAVAVAETMALYRAEAARTHAARKGSKLAGWSRGVDDYVARLAAFEAAIAPHSPVNIQLGADAQVYLQTRGEVVILGSPRVQQQEMLEQRITQHFCSQYPCDSLIRDYSPASGSAIETLPHWTFQLSPIPSCNSGDGLELLFADNSDLLSKRDTCKQLFAEFAQLATALATQARQGVALDWQFFAVVAQPGSTLARVTLNGRAEHIELLLPAVAASASLLNRALPWLISKVKNQPYYGINLVITNTEALVPALRQADGAEPGR
jgi:hypothetical protein